MKKFNWFQKFIGSLAPTDLYMYCQKEKFYKTLLYWIGLVLLVAIISGGYLGNETRQAFRHTLNDFENGKLAPIYYSGKDGLVYSGDGYEIIPYFFTPVIIDTANKMPANELYSMKNYLLFSNTKISIIENNIGFNFNYADFMLFMNQGISFDEIKALLSAFEHSLIPTFILGTIINISLFFVSSGLFVLLTVNIFNIFRRMKVKFGKLVQYVMYAMTVSIVWKGIFTVLLLKYHINYDSIIMFIDNFLIFFYPVLILSIVFKRIKKQILTN